MTSRPNTKLSVSAIITNIITDIETNGISSRVLQNALLACHKMFVESIDILKVLLDVMVSNEMDIKCKSNAIEMCHIWIDKYWIDFKDQSDMINAMESFEDAFYDETKDSSKFLEWFTSEATETDIHQSLQKIISRYTICHFLSLYPNKYIPMEILEIIAIYINITDILSHKLLHNFNEDQMQNES